MGTTITIGENWGLAGKVVQAHTAIIWQSWGRSSRYFKGCDFSHSLNVLLWGWNTHPRISLWITRFPWWCVLLWTHDVMIWAQSKSLQHSPVWPSLLIPSLLHGESYIPSTQVSLRFWAFSLSGAYVAQYFLHLLPSSSYVIISRKWCVMFPEN